MLHAYTPHRKPNISIAHVVGAETEKKNTREKENTRVDLSCVLNEVIVV